MVVCKVPNVQISYSRVVEEEEDDDDGYDGYDDDGEEVGELKIERRVE